MNKKIATMFAFVTTLLVIPAVTSAQVLIRPKTLGDVIDIIITYMNQFLVLMMGVAIVMFVFYIIKFFIKADTDRKEAGPYVMWSLIGFFVILSMWGLVNILQNTFGLQNDINAPKGWAFFTKIFPGGESSGGRQRTPVTGATGSGNNQPTSGNFDNIQFKLPGQ